MNRRSLLSSISGIFAVVFAPLMPLGRASAHSKVPKMYGEPDIKITGPENNTAEVKFSCQEAASQFWEVLAEVVWPDYQKHPDRNGKYCEEYDRYTEESMQSLQSPIQWRLYFEEYGPETIVRLIERGFIVDWPEGLCIRCRTVNEFRFSDT